MKKKWSFLMVLLAGGLVMCKGSQEQKQTSQPATFTQQTTAPAAQEVSNPNPLTTPWPPEPKGEISLAPDLLANNYYVVLDCSGSMKERQCSGEVSKLETAKNALNEFAANVPQGANLGLLTFTNSRIQELVPLGTGNRKQFEKAIQSAFASGETPLHDAISIGYEKLEQQAMSQLGYGRYILVVVTDGAASKGQDPTEKVRWMLDNTPVELYTIGFCIGTDHTLNIPGRTVYKAADNPAELRRGLSNVLAESETFDVSSFSQGISPPGSARKQ